MQKSFVTQHNHAILIVPFLYAFFSRMKGLRGFGFNALTLWVPGLILTKGGLNADWGQTAGHYFAGYLAFICVYEIGYLMNDTWGLRHDSTPRRRLDVTYTPPFFIAFVGLRLVCILGVGLGLELIANPGFWMVLLLLGAAILAHNLLRREEFKMATFFQMSMMRFSTPIFLATSLEQSAWVLVTGLLLFTFPRLLTYQDSKARLRIPERKAPDFVLIHTILVGPGIALVYLASGQTAVVWCWAYFLVFAAALRVLRQKSE